MMRMSEATCYALGGHSSRKQGTKNNAVHLSDKGVEGCRPLRVGGAATQYMSKR